MSLTFKVAVPSVKSSFAKRVEEFCEFKARDNDLALVNFLHENFHDDLSEVEDLRNWTKTLDKLVHILHKYCSSILTYPELFESPCHCVDKAEDAEVIMKVLKFLCILMKAAKDKRYFLSFLELEVLLTAVNIDISSLAAELLFHICIPSSSFSSSIGEDWVDSIEVPESVSKLALNIFRSLSLSHDITTADYLHGQDSPAYITQDDLLRISFPAISSQLAGGKDRGPVSLTLNRGDDCSLEGAKKMKLDFCLTNDEAWTVALLSCFTFGWQSGLDYRIRIVKLRMFSFFLLIHSRISSQELQDFIANGSSFLMEIIALADMGSELMSMLLLPNPYEIAQIAIEIVLGLLESKLRRRSSTTLQSNILVLLDLERNSQSASLSTTECWTNVVTSACSLGGLMFSNAPIPCNFKNAESKYWNSVGKMIRLGLELYALALYTRAPQHVVTDAPLIGIMVGLLNASLESISRAIHQPFNSLPLSACQVQSLLVIAKALYCLELTIERQGYVDAFRESNGLQPTVAILNLFYEFNSDQLTVLLATSSIRNVLDSTMSVLHYSIQKGRQNAMGLLSTAVDTGLRCVQDPSFLQFAHNLLGTSFAGNEILWGQLIMIIREVIDIDPSFLSQFLLSSCALAITKAFVSKSPLMVGDYLGDVDLEKIVVPLARFALAAGVTTEGKKFVDESCLIDFVIASLHSPLSVLPQSLGISPDRLSKLGKVLAQVLLDNDLIRSRARESLRNVVKNLCREAEALWMMMDVVSQTALDSPRMQVLQKLTNMCTMLESMFSDNRRHSTEAVRDVLSDVIPCLFNAFKCTLPPCDQLLAQVSIKTTVTYPHLGNGASVKAISNLLKVGISYLPQLSIPIIFKEIDDTLGQISAAKQSLSTFSDDKSKDGSKISEESGEYDEGLGSRPPSRRSRSRGSSLGNQSGVKVYVMGVLDSIPHLCMADPLCEDLWISNSRHKYFVWKFMQSILYLEWLSIMLSHAVRASQRTGLSTLVNEKDVFRRLFAFYRSSLQEVNRFAASRMQSKKWAEAKSLKNIVETMVSSGTDESGSVLCRKPGIFQLRITGFGGALVREGIEIEGSRIVFVADVGTELEASERRTNSAGLIRYRTKLGWISEYRKDQQKSAIVEVLSIGLREPCQEDSSAADHDSSHLLSLREACSLALSRTHSSLRQIAVSLSRVMTSDSSSFRSRTSTNIYLALGTMLTNATKSFMEQADVLIEKLSASAKISMKSISSPNKNENKNIYQETAGADIPSICLFLGSVVRLIIASAIEDKNGCFNLLQLRSFCNNGIIKSIVDSWKALVKVLDDSLKTNHFGLLSANQVMVVDSSGRCALYAICQYTYLIKRLVNRELFNKSVLNWSSSGADLTDENGTYYPSDLYGQLILQMSDLVVDAFEKSLWNKFPPEMQYEWLQIIIDLVQNFTMGQPMSNPNPAGPNRMTLFGSREERSRLGTLRSMLQASYPSDVTSPPIPPPQTIPPNQPSFSASEEVIAFLSNELAFDRNDVIAVMNYLRTNEIEQVAEVISQGEDSGVLLNARASLATASGPQNNNEQANQSVMQVIGSALPNESSPGLSLPNPPPLPDIINLDQHLQSNLPNLVSALGIWDSSGDEIGAGVGIHEIMADSSSSVVNSTQFIPRRTPGLRHNSVSSPGGLLSPGGKKLEAKPTFISTQIERVSIAFPSFLIDICTQFAYLTHWDQHRPDFLIHQVCELLLKISTADKMLSFSNIIQVLVDEATKRIGNDANAAKVQNVFPHFLLLALMLRNAHFMPFIDTDVYGKFSKLCHTVLKLPFDHFENYSSALSAILVFLNEYFQSTFFQDQYIKEELNAILAVPWELLEEKEERLTKESKTDNSKGSRDLWQLRFNAFDIVMKLLQSKSNFDRDTSIAIVILVTFLVKDHRLAIRLVKENHLSSLLQLSKNGVLNSKREKLLGALLVTICKDVSDIYLDISNEIKDMFPCNGEDKAISLDKFIRGMSKTIVQVPHEFFFICQYIIRFCQAKRFDKSNDEKSANSSDSREKFDIAVKLRDEIDGRLRPLLEHDALEQSLQAYIQVLGHLEISIRNDKDYLFSASDILNGLSDAILSLRQGPLVLGKVLTLENNVKLLESLLDLHSYCLPLDEKVQFQSSFLWSTSRFLVALSAFKGATRLISLKAIITRINARKCELQTSKGDRIETECQSLSTLLSLLILMVQASKSNAKATNVKKQQGVSLDSVVFLINNEKLFMTLQEILMEVPYSTSGLKVYLAAMDIVELLTRFKVLDHLSKEVSVKDVSMGENAEKLTNHQGGDEVVELEENPSGLSADQGTERDVINEQRQDSVNAEEDNDREEENESDQNDEDEDEEEEDYDNEENNDDENDDHDNDDNDEGDQTAVQEPGPAEEVRNEIRSQLQELARNIAQIGSRLVNDQGAQAIDDSYVNVDHAGAVTDRSGIALAPNIFSTADARGRIAMELQDFNMPGAAFITPPNLRNEEFQLIMHDLSNADNEEGAMDRIADLARLLGGPMDLNALPVADHALTHEILPQGLHNALEVGSQAYQHPIFENTSVHSTPDVRSALSRTGSGRIQVISSENNGYRTIFQAGVENSSPLDPFSFPAQSDLRDVDPLYGALQATWPNSQGRNRPSRQVLSQPAAAPSETTLLSIQNMVQEYVTRQLESDDTNEETSQSTATFNSRGAPPADGYSYSLQSMLAVQDPNPRQNIEEESVQGGAIPPLIEFQSPDQGEANEEMSVLTLPQEEPNTNVDNAHFDDVRSTEERRDDLSRSDMEDTISFRGRSFTPLQPMENDELSIAESADGVSLLDNNSAPHAFDEGGQLTIDEQQSPAESMSIIEENTLIPANTVELALEAIVIPSQQPQSTEIHSFEVQSSTLASASEPQLRSVVESNNPIAQVEPSSNRGGLVCPVGYDSDVFFSLPEEMQREIMEQYGETSSQLRTLAEAAGFDYETLMSLPDNIRQEVLDQARRDQTTSQPAPILSHENPVLSTNIDSATFLATLPLELRSEVLLTAEPELLATLPPELVAEAQALRERAASQWQRREIIHSVGGGAPGLQPGPNPGTDDYESEGDEVDEDELDAEEEIYVPRRGRRNATALGVVREDAAKKKRSKDGYMIISPSIQYKVNIPADLLVALVRGLLVPTRQRSEFTATLLRSSQNLCFTMKLKDSLFKLLTGICIHNKSLVNTALHEVTTKQVNFDILMEENNSIFVKSQATLSTSKANDSTNAINSIAAQRILFVLNNLCSGDISYTYLLLATREENFQIVKQNADSEVYARSLAVPDVQSTNSLLEILISNISSFLSATRIPELESMVSLIEQTTLPLEDIQESTIQNNEEDKQINEIAGEKEVKVKVPMVLLSREALGQVCDLLLSDVCNAKIFSLITTAISRLSRIYTNSISIAELLHDVIVDLCQQARDKLISFKANLAKGVEEEDIANDLNGLLTICQSGSEQFDRLLRLISTFQLMADYSKRKFSDIAPFEALDDVTTALDMLLTRLKTYISDDENLEQDAANASPQHTFLVSSLRRILPVIECFFIAYGCELTTLYEAVQITKNSSHNATNTTKSTGGGTQLPITTDEKEMEVSNNSVGPSAADIVAALAKTPGHTYRNSLNYHRANISIFADSSNQGDEKLYRVKSLLRQTSLTANKTSSTFSNLGSSLPSKTARMYQFIQSNSTMLNMLIRSKPSLLEGSMSSLVKVVQFRGYLSFENKRKFFFSKLRKLHRGNRRNVHLQIRRNQVFEDTFHQLRARTGDELRGRMQINFYNEEGIDAGGLTREWYMILSREIFNPNYALFMAAADGATFQPNPLSFIHSNHLDYFKMVGRVIGKAICDEQLMDAHFTKSFYKHVLGLPIDFSDIEATEPDYYKSLKMILEHQIEALGISGMTFTAEIQKFGRTEDINLIPNGSQIPVTDDNKFDYVRLVAHHRMTSAISSQIDAFLSGFYDLVPPDLICIFSPAELELLICGLPDVNLDELQANTDYHQYRISDDTIKWFWNTLRGFNREERAAFLQFVTGTSKVPLGGFANLQGMRGTQKFSIHKAYGGENGLLPTAHTCYNQLDLPVYRSEEELRAKLLMAIKEGSEGFGFA